MLGITIAPPQTVRQLGLEGILVLEAPTGSPANQAGIKGTFRYPLGSYIGNHCADGAFRIINVFRAQTLIGGRGYCLKDFTPYPAMLEDRLCGVVAYDVNWHFYRGTTL